METIYSYIYYIYSYPFKKRRQRASKQSAMEVLAERYAKKLSLKRRSWTSGNKSWIFKQKIEEQERKARLELELE